MDPTTLIPVPEALPVAWGWFEGLNLLTFILHIILVNVLLGGGMVAVYLAFADKGGTLGKAIADRLPTVFALTVNFGVAPLLFLQVLYGQFLYTSAVMSAVWWLLIIALLILGYYAFYINQARQKIAPENGTPYLVAGTAMVFFIAFILTNIITMMARPESWVEYFNNPHGTMLHLLEPTFLPRFLHFLLASIALGGLFLGLLSHYGKTGPDGAKFGMRVFSIATMLQMASGLWWLLALDQVVLDFLSGSIPAMALLFIAIGLTFPTLGAGMARKPVAAALWTVPTIAAMCGVRAVIRGASLAPYFEPGALPVTGEVSPLILFLVTLVIGLGALAYMVRLGFGQKREG